MAKSRIADRRRPTRVEESHGAELPRVRSSARIANPLDIAGLVLVTIGAFVPILRNGFVNWDDPTVLLNNPRLAAPDVLAWALTTTLIGHYQPLAWLAWSAVKSTLGLTAAAFHGLSLLGHVANVVLVYVVARRLVDAAAFDRETGAPISHGRVAALAAPVVFAVHPLRVEPVAWASAFPYILSLTFLLLAFLAYLNHLETSGSSPAKWLMVSIVAYTASCLARASAIGFPLLLLLADYYPLRRHVTRRLLFEKLPFLIVATAFAFAEWHARDIVGLQEVGLGARMTMAAVAPFIYLGRTLAPVRISPLDPLPISPGLALVPLAVGCAGLAAVTLALWTARGKWPALGVAWIAFAVLLAPVVGLTPSGLQATADRYMYVPGVIVSLAAGLAVARYWPSGRLAVVTSVVAAVVVAVLGGLTWIQTGYWHDSITLWTRAADLDPRNDIATYNLAIALAESGREEEAMSRYEQTLRLVPDHDLARRNLAIIQGARAERDADRLAAAGRLNEASDLYTRALALDANRLHARAARGILLVRAGRFAEAAADLGVAFDAGVKDAEVPNALAFALMQTGQFREATSVLKRAIAQHPENVNLAHNLARLLATSPDRDVRDGALALRLALDVRERTGGRDPRALDTLAAAYAASGRLDMARETSREAAALAQQLGDVAAATEIAAHARSYRR
jgi:Flp pilus assembly protein TadD